MLDHDDFYGLAELAQARGQAEVEKCLSNYLSTHAPWVEEKPCPRCGRAVACQGTAQRHTTTVEGRCPRCGTAFEHVGCYGYDSVLHVLDVKKNILAPGDDVFVPGLDYCEVAWACGHVAVLRVPVFNGSPRLKLRWIPTGATVQTRIWERGRGRARFYFRK